MQHSSPYKTDSVPFLAAYEWYMPLVAELSWVHASVVLKLASSLTKHGEVLISLSPDEVGECAGLENYSIKGVLYDLEATGVISTRSLPKEEKPYIGISSQWEPSLENLYRGRAAQYYRAITYGNHIPEYAFIEHPYNDELVKNGVLTMDIEPEVKSLLDKVS